MVQVQQEVDMAFKILVADDHIYDRTNEIYELPAMLRAAGYDLVWEYHQEERHELHPAEKRVERPASMFVGFLTRRYQWDQRRSRRRS